MNTSEYVMVYILLLSMNLQEYVVVYISLLSTYTVYRKIYIVKSTLLQPIHIQLCIVGNYEYIGACSGVYTVVLLSTYEYPGILA
jgi:TctA family transporter